MTTRITYVITGILILLILGVFVLFLRGPGHSTDQSEQDVTSENEDEQREQQREEITFHDSVQVNGQVRSSRGWVVGDGRVLLYRPNDVTDQTASHPFWYEDVYERELQISEDGTFQVEDLSPGPWLFVYHAPDHRLTLKKHQFPGEKSEYTLETVILQEERNLSVTVQDTAGQPIPQAELVMFPFPQYKGLAALYNLDKAEGTQLSLPIAPNNELVLSLTTPVRDTVQKRVSPDQESVIFELEEFNRTRFTIQMADDSSLPEHIQVWLIERTRFHEYKTLRQQHIELSDEMVEIKDLPEGHLILLGLTPDQYAGQIDLSEQSSPPGEAIQEMTLEKMDSVETTVYDAETGETIKNAYLQHAHFHQLFSEQTDSSGVVTLSTPVTGPLVVVAPGYAPRVLPERQSGEPVPDRIELKKGGRLDVQLPMAPRRDVPVEAMLIHTEHPFLHAEKQISNPDFSFDHLMNGTYKLHFLVNESIHSTHTVDIEKGESARLEVGLPEGDSDSE